MQAAGLEPVADFDELPVSGFGDVVPRVFRLRRILATLKKLLAREDCVAFRPKVAVLALFPRNSVY